MSTVALLSSLIESAVLQAVPPSERNIAKPHEEEEEWVAVTGGGFERIVTAAAHGVSSASRTVAKKRRTRKNMVCNNMPCGLKGTPHDGLCTHMAVFGKRGGRRESVPAATRCVATRPTKRGAVRFDLNDTSSEDETDDLPHAGRARW